MTGLEGWVDDIGTAGGSEVREWAGFEIQRSIGFKNRNIFTFIFFYSFELGPLKREVNNVSDVFFSDHRNYVEGI